MEGHLTMSQEERLRLIVMDRVSSGALSVRDASSVLGICYRQASRLLGAYKAEGAGGLVHGSRGKPSNHHCDPALREAVIEAYKSKYPDFGPTLASEKLLELDGLRVQAETLRLWLAKDGAWKVQPRRLKHRSKRKRKEHFGELVQFDGSLSRVASFIPV